MERKNTPKTLYHRSREGRFPECRYGRFLPLVIWYIFVKPHSGKRNENLGQNYGSMTEFGANLGWYDENQWYIHTKQNEKLSEPPLNFLWYLIGQYFDEQNWQDFGLGVKFCLKVLTQINLREHVFANSNSQFLYSEFRQFLPTKSFVQRKLCLLMFCPIGMV